MICSNCGSDCKPFKERAQSAREWLRTNLRWQHTGVSSNGTFPPTKDDKWWVWSAAHLEREIEDDAAAIAMYERMSRS